LTAGGGAFFGAPFIILEIAAFRAWAAVFAACDALLEADFDLEAPDFEVPDFEADFDELERLEELLRLDEELREPDEPPEREEPPAPLTPILNPFKSAA
jgi:hypothetical protein